MAPSSPRDATQGRLPDDTVDDDESIHWTAERLISSSYKDLGSPATVEDRFLRHLLRHCRHCIERLLAETSSTTKDYSITIDAFDFLQANPILGHLLLRYPATLLPLLEAAVVRAQRECLQQKQEELGVREVAIANLRVKGEKGANGGNLTRVHARLVHLPPTSTGSTPSLSEILQASHVGRMVQVSGTVVRTSNVQMYESARTYKCKDCQRTFVVAADVEQRHNALRAPEQCPLILHDPAASNNNSNNPSSKGGNAGRRCRGTKFTVVPDGSIHTDYQEIKIQETNNSTASSSIGQIPRSLLVKVQHDLVDTCQPGDQVIVVGSLLAQWPAQGTLIPDADCQVDMAMMAHSVRVVDDQDSSHNTNSNSSDLEQYQRDFDRYWLETAKNQEFPIQARDFICQAICPKLYGMAIIKLALLVTLIGGVSSDAYQQSEDHLESSPSQKRQRLEQDDRPDQFKLPTHAPSRQHHSTAWNGTQPLSSQEVSPSIRSKRNARVQTRRRDQSHLLLVGDPGLGKSQFLKYAAALAPRSVLTTGVGTTSAGLTCAAVRDGNTKEFSLEAGALVLADKGVCCIDEFGCIQDQDRTTIHEAMEQQTLSVAKAGIVCKLNCRATIIAVMNPRDCIYNNQSSLSVNTGLGTPLLSRFDLIFKLVDSADAERDNNVTMYLLNRAIQGAGLDVTETTGGSGASEPWSMEKLRAYIAVVRERFRPTMSKGAAMLLEAHYERCRSAQSNTIPVTVRFLESLIRLSQAHARLMYRNEVTLQDAVAVIRLMECSAFAYGGFDGRNLDDYADMMYCDPMTVDFSDEADVDFACFEYRVLALYGMLDYMPRDRRTRATNAMGHGSHSAGNSGWNEFANPRDRG